jgi:hypothetical protein
MNSRDITTDSRELTKEAVVNMLPKGTNTKVTDKVFDAIKSMGKVTNIDQEICEDVLRLKIPLLAKVSCSLMNLVNAVNFCSIVRTTACTNREAYKAVFPEKYDKAVREGKQVDSNISAFATSDIVMAVQEAMIIPNHIEYYPLHRKMIQRQYEVAMDNVYDAQGKKIKVGAMVMQKAITDLLDRTAMPQELQVKVTQDVGANVMSVAEILESQLKLVSKAQMARLDSGEDIETVQSIPVNLESPNE